MTLAIDNDTLQKTLEYLHTLTKQIHEKMRPFEEMSENAAEVGGYDPLAHDTLNAYNDELNHIYIASNFLHEMHDRAIVVRQYNPECGSLMGEKVYWDTDIQKILARQVQTITTHTTPNLIQCIDYYSESQSYLNDSYTITTDDIGRLSIELNISQAEQYEMECVEKDIDI